MLRNQTEQKPSHLCLRILWMERFERYYFFITSIYEANVHANCKEDVSSLMGKKKSKKGLFEYLNSFTFSSFIRGKPPSESRFRFASSKWFLPELCILYWYWARVNKARQPFSTLSRRRFYSYLHYQPWYIDTKFPGGHVHALQSLNKLKAYDPSLSPEVPHGFTISADHAHHQ